MKEWKKKETNTYVFCLSRICLVVRTFTEGVMPQTRRELEGWVEAIKVTGLGVGCVLEQRQQLNGHHELSGKTHVRIAILQGFRLPLPMLSSSSEQKGNNNGRVKPHIFFENCQIIFVFNFWKSDAFYLKNSINFWILFVNCVICFVRSWYSP